MYCIYIYIYNAKGNLQEVSNPPVTVLDIKYSPIYIVETNFKQKQMYFYRHFYAYAIIFRCSKHTHIDMLTYSHRF